MKYFIGVVFILIMIVVINKTQDQLKNNRIFQKKIQDFQLKHKLSDADLNLFKNTMGEAKDQIIEWETLVNQSKRMKQIPKVLTAIKSAKEIFRRLMDNPKNMTEMNDFLYTKLPGILDATKRFTDIEKSKIETSEIGQSLKVITKTIMVVSESIIDDYEIIVQKEADEVTVTQRIVEDQ